MLLQQTSCESWQNLSPIIAQQWLIETVSNSWDNWISICNIASWQDFNCNKNFLRSRKIVFQVQTCFSMGISSSSNRLHWRTLNKDGLVCFKGFYSIPSKGQYYKFQASVYRHWFFCHFPFRGHLVSTLYHYSTLYCLFRPHNTEHQQRKEPEPFFKNVFVMMWLEDKLTISQMLSGLSTNVATSAVIKNVLNY